MGLLGEGLTQVLILAAALLGIGFALLQSFLVSKVRVSDGAENRYSENLIEGEEEGVDNFEVSIRCAEIQSAISVGVESFQEILRKASGPLRSSVQGAQKVGKSEAEANGVQSISSGTQRTGESVVEDHSKISIVGVYLECRRALQARLLKVTSPKALPHILKNALSASLLIDIIKCVATFFIEDMDLAVKYLENLTKVPRFSILIMCLSSADKADLYKLWDEVFSNEATPMKYAEILDNLRSKYAFNHL